MEEASGPLVDSVSGLSATASGTPQYQERGKHNYSIRFNGSTSFNTSAQSVYPSGDFTFSLWCRQDQSNSIQQNVLVGWPGIDHYLSIYLGTQIYFGGIRATRSRDQSYEIFYFPGSGYHHLVLRRRSGYVDLAVDASFYVIGDIADSYSGRELYIGGPQIGFFSNFSGDIDEVYLWGRALSDSAIERLYNYGHGRFLTP